MSLSLKHPHEVASESDEAVASLVSLTEHPKVVGIGETGLDFYYEHSPRARQEEVFRAHCQAARTTGLPLIVHTRDADTARILAGEKPPSGVILASAPGANSRNKRLNWAFTSRSRGFSLSRMPAISGPSRATCPSSAC